MTEPRTAADAIRANAVEARRLDELKAFNRHKAEQHARAIEMALPSVLGPDGRVIGRVLMRVSCIRSRGKKQCDRRLAVVVPSSEGPLLVSLADRRPLLLPAFGWAEAVDARCAAVDACALRCPSHGTVWVNPGVIDAFRRGERATTADSVWSQHRPPPPRYLLT